jgi:hypothetical protein
MAVLSIIILLLAGCGGAFFGGMLIGAGRQGHKPVMLGGGIALVLFSAGLIFLAVSTQMAVWR